MYEFGGGAQTVGQKRCRENTGPDIQENLQAIGATSQSPGLGTL